jgi:hypothetical protein
MKVVISVNGPDSAGRSPAVFAQVRVQPIRHAMPQSYRLRCSLLLLTLHATALGQLISPPRVWNDKDLEE